MRVLVSDSTQYSGLSAEPLARLTCVYSDTPYAAPRDVQSL
jgi:hypothetical protein